MNPAETYPPSVRVDAPARFALVGLGYWGSKLLRNLTQLVGAANVVAIDSDPLARERANLDYPAISAVSDLTSVLKDPDVVAVLVATPAGTHAAIAAQCLFAGKHVFVEKPLATSFDAALELVETAREVGRTLMVGHTFLFSPRVEWLKAYIEDGEAGPINYLTSSRMNLGLYRGDANVIWDLAPHDFSIICHLLGEQAETVQASARCCMQPGTPDVAFIGLTFPSGAIASVALSWMAPRKVRHSVLVGERRMIVYDDTDTDEPVKVYDKGVVLPDSAGFGENQLTYRYGDTTAPYIDVEEPLARQLAHFVSSIRTGRPCRSDGAFGADIVALIEAADRSWQEGGAVVEVRRRQLVHR